MSIKVIDNVATSENLKKMFLEHEFTPQEIQRGLNLESVQAVYKWINPKYKSIPSLDNLIQLTHILDCTLDDIIVQKVMGESPSDCDDGNW